MGRKVKLFLSNRPSNPSILSSVPTQLGVSSVATISWRWETQLSWRLLCSWRKPRSHSAWLCKESCEHSRRHHPRRWLLSRTYDRHRKSRKIFWFSTGKIIFERGCCCCDLIMVRRSVGDTWWYADSKLANIYELLSMKYRNIINPEESFFQPFFSSNTISNLQHHQKCEITE